MPKFYYMASNSDKQHESLYKRVYGEEMAKGFSFLLTDLHGNLMLLDFS